MPIDIDQLWACVHGELAAEDRSALDQTLRDDPALRANLARLQAMDRMLRRLLPLAETKDEDLEARILEAWEQSPEAQALNASAPDQPAFRLLKGRARAAAWRLTAIAAGLLLVAGLYSLYGPPAAPLQWLAPEIAGPPALRGTDQPLPRAYADPAFFAFSSTLGDAIHERFTRKTASRPNARGFSFRRPPQWDLQARFQELRAGYFLVTVKACRRGQSAVQKEWTLDFSGPDSFNRQVGAWADRIADELVALGTKEMNHEDPAGSGASTKGAK